MGACGSDLTSKFGPEFAKFVAVQQSEQFVDIRLKQIKQNIFSETKKMKLNIFDNIDDQEAKTKQKISVAAKQIDQKNKGQLSKAASLQRKSIQEIVGVSQISGMFQNLREQVQKSFEQNQIRVIDQIQEVGVDQKQRLERQKPSIGAYNKLSASQQQKAMKQGQKQYKKQIEQQNKIVGTQINHRANSQQFSEMFNKINPTEQLRQIQKKTNQLILAAGKMNKTSSVFC